MTEEKTIEERLEAIEEQVFNHIPGRLDLLDEKVRWVLRLTVAILAFVAVVVGMALAIFLAV